MASIGDHFVTQDSHLPPPMADQQELLSVEDLVRRHGCSLDLPPRFIMPSPYRSQPPHQIPAIRIPIIDLSTSRSLALAQIHSACRDWGFFQVINHGVSLESLESLRTAAMEFLALPTAHKTAPQLVRDKDGDGFAAGFVDPQIGATEWRDILALHTFPKKLRNYSKWPPMLKDPIATSSLELLNLTRRLLAVFSENLQLPPSFIEDALGDLRQVIVISHYPPCPQPELAMGSCQHTDIGVITCVWQASEGVGGLQVRKDGQWHAVEPLRDAIVINVADQLQILSNGQYKSGTHRVVVNGSKPRISVLAFHNPAADVLVSPAATLVDSDHPALYEPTLFESFAADYGIKAK